MNHSSIRRLVMTALCVALGVVLPQALHAVPNAGNVLLPMHIPLLLCGLTCSWAYGLACGVLTPVISHLVSGMPPAAVLPAMVCELAAYGLISGLAAKYIHTGKRTLDVYLQLIAAMLIGFTHLVALYAAMAQIGTESNLGYLVPRVALSLATTAVWSVFCALSFLAPWAASARTRDALAIAGLAAAVLLIAVSAG